MQDREVDRYGKYRRKGTKVHIIVLTIIEIVVSVISIGVSLYSIHQNDGDNKTTKKWPPSPKVCGHFLA